MAIDSPVPSQNPPDALLPDWESFYIKNEESEGARNPFEIHPLVNPRRVMAHLFRILESSSLYKGYQLKADIDNDGIAGTLIAAIEKRN